MARIITLIYYALWLSSSQIMAQKDAEKLEYWHIYDAFMDLEPDDGQMAEVTDLQLVRDVGKFTLVKGVLYLCKPINGKVYAAIFRGEGVFSFTPPTRVETEQLERFYDKPSLSETFKSLFIVFADSTLPELQKKLTFSPKKPRRDFRDDVEYAIKYLHRKTGKQFDNAIMKTVLESETNGFFYAHFSDHKTDPLFFEINPFQEEEVRFMRRLKGPSYLYIAEVINQFHQQSDYLSGADQREEDKSRLHISEYDLDVTLKGSQLKFSATATISFELLMKSQSWLELNLFAELEIDSAFWENGEPVEFVKEKENPYLWIKCDRDTEPGEQRQITFHYRGDLIERARDWFYIRSSRNWYPKHGTRKKADFRVTYRYPENFQFAGSGEFVSADTLDKMIVSHWKSPEPMHNMSFNIGFFTDYKIVNDTIPPVTIQMAETGHREIAHSLAAQGIGSGRNMEVQVGKDVRRSMTLFQEMLAPLPLNHFFATDIPFSHGEAFPGLIHLSWQTFQMTRNSGDDEVFRAHEVAHQWWGIGVDFATYHDQWISEAFSEYCGWLYLHDLVKKEEDNDDKFYDLLETRRKEITGNRKFLLGDGQKAGPIWLGYRTLSSDTQGDYRLIIYQKGAWVLHMIRSMLTDTETLDDSRFRQLLGEFYRKYAGSQASTAHFISFLESFTGEKWDWFFNQWVFGTDIPTYIFSHNIAQSPSGEYLVSCRVSQEDAPQDFKMPVFVGVTFENDRIEVYRQLVDGETTFEIGPFSEKPKNIIFNHLESVLCETKSEKWQH